jgi:hypothetical protein
MIHVEAAKNINNAAENKRIGKATDPLSLLEGKMNVNIFYKNIHAYASSICFFNGGI